MAKSQRLIGNREHWAIRDLLDRYAELLETGKDAEGQYPQVAEHLAMCADCRDVLFGMMTPEMGENVAPPITVDDLPFMQTEESQLCFVRPGSTTGAFEIKLTIPLAVSEHMPTRSEGPLRTRGFRPIQPGGRLLYYDVVPLGDQEVDVMLMLNNAEMPRRYAITGVLDSDSLPALIYARLYVGDDLYFAEVRSGQVTFENVALDDDQKQISIAFETPD
jgi:hypothetical protein